MNKLRYFRHAIAFLSAVCLTVALFVGCGKSSLAPGGAYSFAQTNGMGSNAVVSIRADLQLYQADVTFQTAYKAAVTICDFELKNRTYLWNISPSIKHTIDRIRPQIWEATKAYTSARDAYILNPTPVGLAGVDAVIAKIQQLLVAATAALGTTSNTAPITGTTNSLTH